MQPPESELEILTYSDFGVGIRWLAQQVVDDDWIPDAILGVIRGGAHDHLTLPTTLRAGESVRDLTK